MVEKRSEGNTGGSCGREPCIREPPSHDSTSDFFLGIQVMPLNRAKGIMLDNGGVIFGQPQRQVNYSELAPSMIFNG